MCSISFNDKPYQEKKFKGLLKLVSAIFDQFFIFSPNDSLLKTVKTFFY